MKKRLLPKIAGVAALYAVIFLVLSLLQFAKQGSFSRQLGDLRVSGKFSGKNSAQQADGEFLVEDGVGVFFGGLEFFLSSSELYGLNFLSDNGNRVPVAPESMILSAEAVHFKLTTPPRFNRTSTQRNFGIVFLYTTRKRPRRIGH